MFDTDIVTLPPAEYVPDWLLPPDQFFIDERELSEPPLSGSGSSAPTD